MTLRPICVCTIEVLSHLLHSGKRLRAFLSCRLWMGPWYLLNWMSQNIFVCTVVKREVDCTSCKAINSFFTNNFSCSFWCNEIVIIVARFWNLKMLSVPNIKRCLSTSIFTRKLFFTCTPLRHYWPTGESNFHWFFERKICFCLKQKPELPGIIENVTLVNFLCHSHLYVPFGPRVNFITGRNGSKSLKGVIFIRDY